MPAFLKRDNDILTVELSGMQKAEFSDALARVKSIPGRRFNPEEKRWELPADADTAMRVMQMLAPVASAEVQAMVLARAEEVAEDLLTRTPPSAKLANEWTRGLFPFQRAFAAWALEHPHSILADEMGLGKTVEALTAWHEARARYDAGAAGPLSEGERDLPILVVCPNAVRGTWRAEAEHGPLDEDGTPIIPEWPGVEVQVIDGKNPGKRRQQLERDAELFIVNWEKLATRVKLAPELAERPWAAVFADEAHRAKNRKAQQTKALFKVQAPLQFAITGTPIMVSPDDLWSLLRWLRPEQYTSFWQFHYSYVDEYATRYGNVMTGVKNIDQLRFELADKLIRRRKRDVLRDLPEKLPPQVIEVELSPAQRRLYREAETALLLDIKAYIEEHEADASEIEGLSLQRLKGLIPNAGARIAKLRQITAAAKIPAAEELIRDAGAPVVAFTWHVEIARQLAEKLSAGKPRLAVGTIAGTDDADPPKDAFQSGELDHLVCTISKGGTGLTLTRSSHALMVEEDWVPAINGQAVDRLHRHGQKNAVTTTILRVPDTVDTGKVAASNRFKELITMQVMGD